MIALIRTLREETAIWDYISTIIVKESKTIEIGLQEIFRVVSTEALLDAAKRESKERGIYSK